MKHNRGPQEHTRQPPCKTQISEVQRDRRTVNQHANKRRAGPAADSQCNQGDAGHASNRCGGAGKFPDRAAVAQRATASISNANPVATSATAAKMSTFFIAR